MNITREREKPKEFVGFHHLEVGEVFSFDDCSGLMLKISDKQYFDLEDNEVREYISDFPYALLVPREAEVRILDNYPADFEEEQVHNTFEYVEGENLDGN
jgi:hypothetical protein